MAINKITDEQLHKIRKKSAKALPDRPTREGYNAEQIKSHLADFVLDDVDSFKAEVDRIVDEANKELNDTNKKFEEKLNNTDFENRVDEIYKEMGNVSMGDGSTFNYARKLKEESANIAPLENKVYSGSFSMTWGSFNIPLLQNLTLKAGKKYSWSAKIKSSDGCRMNKLGLTTNAETLINLYDFGTLTNNYITVSKTFTPTTDIVVNSIYAHNATVGSVDIKEIMVVEGDLKNYQQYNQKHHITNSEAEFLKDRFSKSYNLLPLENKEYSFDATSQYGWVRVPLGKDYLLKAGTYSLNMKMKESSDTGVFNKFSFD